MPEKPVPGSRISASQRRSVTFATAGAFQSSPFLAFGVPLSLDGNIGFDGRGLCRARPRAVPLRREPRAPVLRASRVGLEPSRLYDHRPPTDRALHSRESKPDREPERGASPSGLVSAMPGSSPRKLLNGASPQPAETGHSEMSPREAQGAGGYLGYRRSRAKRGGERAREQLSFVTDQLEGGPKVGGCGVALGQLKNRALSHLCKLPGHQNESKSTSTTSPLAMPRRSDFSWPDQ
jgi:hypothetical protein